MNKQSKILIGILLYVVLLMTVFFGAILFTLDGFVFNAVSGVLIAVGVGSEIIFIWIYLRQIF